MEEFSFVNPLCFFDVIVPLLMKRFVAFIGITTVSSELDNFVNDFIRRKVFYHVEYTMVCPPCRRAGKEESCDHYEYKTPPWLTKEGQEFTKKNLWRTTCRTICTRRIRYSKSSNDELF